MEYGMQVTISGIRLRLFTGHNERFFTDIVKDILAHCFHLYLGPRCDRVCALTNAIQLELFRIRRYFQLCWFRRYNITRM